MHDQEDAADDLIKDVMLEIMAVLYDHGINEVSVGALMRVLGVETQHARKHDNDYLIIQDSITEFLSTTKDSLEDLTIPPNTTIHWCPR